MREPGADHDEGHQAQGDLLVLAVGGAKHQAHAPLDPLAKATVRPRREGSRHGKEGHAGEWPAGPHARDGQQHAAKERVRGAGGNAHRQRGGHQNQDPPVGASHSTQALLHA